MTDERSNLDGRTRPTYKLRDFLALGCISLLAVLTRIPISRGPLWGDDALLLRASRMPNGYASDFWLGLVQTGSAKYRPVLSSVLALTLDQFGNDQFAYLIMSNLLLTLVALLVFVVCRKLGGSTLLSFVLSSLVLISRFSWYSQDNVFGIMEAGALVFVLLSTFQCLRSIEDISPSSRKLFLSATLLLVATLIHERYLLLSGVFPFAFLIVLVLHRSTYWQRAFRFSLVFTSIPVIHILLKSGLLNVSTLTGGGESNFSEVKGPWIAKHFLQTIASFTGLSDGYRYSAEHWGIPSWIFLPLMASVLVIGICSLIVFCNQRLRLSTSESDLSRGRSDFTLLLLLGALASTSMSASLVVERIEFRWIYAPFIFFLLLLAYIHSHMSNRLVQKSLVAILPILLAIELLYSPLHKIYEAPRTRVTVAVTEVAASAPMDKPWNLRISTRNWENWQWWQYAYGYVFTQIPNPPQSIEFFQSKPKRHGCLTTQRISCVALFIDGQSSDVSSFFVGTK